MKLQYRHAIVAEFLGTALLLGAVVGSGIMGERLAGGNPAIALLANSIATGAMLAVLITVFGPLSGAHFNPVVSLSMSIQGRLSPRAVPRYVIAQVVGGLVGVGAANVMFGLTPFALSQHVRAGGAQMFSEFVATFGLLLVILLCLSHRVDAVAYVVACYITAAYWFTSSTSFANPAVTFARAFTDTFSGIRLMDVPAFALAQTIGAASALAIFRWMAKKGTA